VVVVEAELQQLVQMVLELLAGMVALELLLA
jgi:hypothetical protein